MVFARELYNVNIKNLWTHNIHWKQMKLKHFENSNLVKICGTLWHEHLSCTGSFILQSCDQEAKMYLTCYSKSLSLKQHYKLATDIVEAHCKGEETMVEIRKYKQEEILLKKHKEGVASSLNSQLSSVMIKWFPWMKRWILI